MEIRFGDGLRIVPKAVKLENERSRYKIDVVYPQIEGSSSPKILALNRHIRDRVTETYRWALKPASREDLRYYEKWPGVYNSVDVDYEITLASDALLSIYLEAYHYGLGAAHATQESFTVNYDFRSGRLLKLSDLFKSNAKSLGLISRYCIDELTRNDSYIIRENLAAIPENFENWTINREGIRFNFDACEVDGCAGGAKRVKIPFAALGDILKPNGPASGLCCE